MSRYCRPLSSYIAGAPRLPAPTGELPELLTRVGVVHVELVVPARAEYEAGRRIDGAELEVPRGPRAGDAKAGEPRVIPERHSPPDRAVVQVVPTSA